MENTVIAASPLDITVRGWISAKDKYPRIGQQCIVCIEGIVQNEIYTLDGGDECPQYWSRDDIDECPFVKDSDYWIPLPEAPNAKVRGDAPLYGAASLSTAGLAGTDEAKKGGGDGVRD